MHKSSSEICIPIDILNFAECDVTKEHNLVLPPPKLYYGTCKDKLNDILNRGIYSKFKKPIYLSKEAEKAECIGKHYCSFSIIIIDAYAMYKNGIKFYAADNNEGFWTDNYINSEYISNYI